MPDQASAHLWDLRAQGELFLRELTSAHKCLEEYREGHPDALAKLRKEFGGILHTLRALSQSAADAEAHLAELPERYVSPGLTLTAPSRISPSVRIDETHEERP
jgi:hypothetical protein